MSHIGIALVLVALTGSQGPAQGPAAGQLIDKLAQRVEFGGFDDPKMTLQDALEYLCDRYDIQFDVDEKAFAEAIGTDNPRSVLQDMIAAMPIPKMRGAELERVLRKILFRLDVPSGATYLIQRDTILITTGRAASKEALGDSERELPPLVHRNMVKRLLKDALDEIAEQTQRTVVLDETVAEKAKDTVSAKFRNTPIETAVRVLADKVGLTMVRLDNVLYVTTHEKAQTLRDDIRREKGERARERMPRADEIVKDK
jgi:hypothetical protein